jgi:hypothetical protein
MKSNIDGSANINNNNIKNSNISISYNESKSSISDGAAKMLIELIKGILKSGTPPNLIGFSWNEENAKDMNMSFDECMSAKQELLMLNIIKPITITNYQLTNKGYEIGLNIVNQRFIGKDDLREDE